MAPSLCTICQVAPEDIWMSTNLVVAVPHADPIAPGHLVLAPRRHVANFYDLELVEQRALWNALSELCERIGATLDVSSFHAGFVDCTSGEQACFHTYIHLVPRVAQQPLSLPGGAEWVKL